VNRYFRAVQRPDFAANAEPGFRAAPKGVPRRDPIMVGEAIRAYPERTAHLYA
jgi:hypothetical protein